MMSVDLVLLFGEHLKNRGKNVHREVYIVHV